MLKFIAAYVATALVFLALDGVWLTVAGTRLYKPEIGALLADKVRLAPALAFYLIYVAGMVYFCVAPSVSAQGWTAAAVKGLVLGIVAYGAYDLTCQATMKLWSTKVTLADLGWGAFASAVASTAGLYALRFADRHFG